MTKRSILYFSFLLFCFGILYAEEADTTLTQDPVDLNELVVKTSVVKRDATKDVVTITDAMRKGTTRSIDLLGNVPGLFVNPMTEKVSVDNNNDVPVYVDGNQVSPEYANNINPARIARVEIIRVPLGQYSGLPAVVNIILKNDFEGWDTHVSAYGAVDLRKTPTYFANLLGNFALSGKKSNLYGYLYLQQNRTVQGSSETSDIFGEQLTTVPIDKSRPNALEKTLDPCIFLGWDYELARNHVLTVQTNIRHRTFWSSNYSTYIKPDFHKRVSEKTPTQDYAGNLIYSGVINNKVSLHADVLYQNYSEKSEYSIFFDEKLSDHTDVGNTKHYVRGDARINYKPTSKLSLAIEDFLTWRRYDARNRLTDLSLYNGSELRNTLLGSVSWTPSQKFSMSGSLQYLAVHNSYNSEGRHQVQDTHTPQPDVSVYWQALPKLRFRARYIYGANYPVLTQLSPTRSLLSPHRYSQGNPDLRHALSHTANANIYFSSWLSAYYSFNHTNDAALIYFYPENNENIIQSYINGTKESHTGGLFLTYATQTIYLRGTASYTHSRIKSPIADARNGYSWNASLYAQYFISPIQTVVALDYNISKGKAILPQAEINIPSDNLSLSLSRNFIKNKLQVMLSATLPVHVLSRYQHTVIDTPGYQVSEYRFNGFGDRVVSLRVNLTLGNQKTGNMSKAFELEDER